VDENKALLTSQGVFDKVLLLRNVIDFGLQDNF